MSALASIVIFLVVLNGAFGLVNTLGITGSTNQFVSSPNVNITAVQAAGSCQYSNVTGSTCTNDFGNIPIISTLVTFGDFLWSIAKMIVFMPMVVALPALFLIQNFYAPPLWAGLYNLVFWILLIFWFNQLVSGRYQFEAD